MKHCGACGIVKRYSEFSRDRSRRDGYMVRCKECDRQRNRKAYARKVGKAARAPIASCSIDGCTESHVARGYCARHYAAWNRKRKGDRPTVSNVVIECEWCGAQFFRRSWNARFCSRTCKHKNRDATVGNRGDRKRARHYGVEYEYVDRAKVYERDKWTCGICGSAIDRTAEYPASLSVSLDHVIPMSKGGPHTYSNVQAAHWVCNQAKGATVEGEQSGVEFCAGTPLPS